MKQSKRKFKTNKQIAWMFFVVAAAIVILIATNLLATFIGAKIKSEGASVESPEYAIAETILHANPNTYYQYVVQDDVLLVVTSDNNSSTTFNMIKDEKNKRFRFINNILVLGESMYSLGFNAGIDGATLFKDQGRYIVAVPIAGYSASSDIEQRKGMININEIEVYDNLGRPLEYIEVNNMKYYYYVGRELPENYKVYMSYQGKEYELLDSNKLFYRGTL